MSEVDYTFVINRLAKRWQLNERQRCSLLGLAPAALPDLLEIDTTLNQLFAASPLLAELWMTSQNKAFGNISPMDLIEKEGAVGLSKVLRFLCLDR